MSKSSNWIILLYLVANCHVTDSLGDFLDRTFDKLRDLDKMTGQSECTITDQVIHTLPMAMVLPAKYMVVSIVSQNSGERLFSPSSRNVKRPN